MILAVFFTRGVSLQLWLETGLFEREKQIYEAQLECGYLKKVYWLTYGVNDRKISKELIVNKKLHSSIEVIGMPKIFNSRIGKIVYSFFVPIIKKKHLSQVDMYKTNQMDGSWSGILSKMMFGIPLVVRTGYTLSSYAQNMRYPKFRIFIYKIMEWAAYGFSDRVIVASKKDADFIVNTYGCLQRNVSILPNYINTDLFKPINKERYEKRVVFVGRLSREKNLFNLISAISRTELWLDIYGQGDLMEKLQKHAKTVNAKVNFYGVVSNDRLPKILNRYKYYILPSYFEGMPKTLLEAMACGCICVGTDVAGINEILRDGFNGHLSNGNDTDAIYHAICRAMKGNSDIIAKNAVETIQKRYSLKVITQMDRAFLSV